MRILAAGKKLQHRLRVLKPIFFFVFCVVVHDLSGAAPSMQLANASSGLPACQGENSAWDSCFGELKTGSILVYAGGWKAGQPHGRGVFAFPNGTRYIGEFLNGRQHGRGILVYPQGGSLSGTWVNDKRQGEFILTLQNGSKQNVFYVDDELSRNRPAEERPSSDCAQPEYPVAARRSGAEGTVVILYTMDVDGSIVDAEIEKPSGPSREHKLIDRIAVDAVKKCKGRPGLVNGVPIKSQGRLQYVYRLQ
jgi:TonB family protein